MGNMRQEMLGNKSKAGRLNQALHGVLSKRNITAAVIIGGMLLAACGYTPAIGTSQNRTHTPLQPAVSKTMSVTMTPEVTAAVTPTEEATATATEVTVRTEFARGEVMTPEEIKVNVDWYYNLSDEELSQLTQGKLWSFSEYKGDNRPRDIDGNVLSETQDLGYFYALRDEIKDWGTIFESEFYNAVFLGLTKVKDENGVEYFVGVVGMKDVKGERMVAYGVVDIVGYDQMSGAIFHSNMYGGVRYFGRIFGLPYNEDVYVQRLLNGQTTKVVLTVMGQLIQKGAYLPGKEFTLLEQTNGDETLFGMLKSQYAGGVDSPKTYFEEILAVNGTLPLEFNEENIAKLARIVLLGIDELD